MGNYYFIWQLQKRSIIIIIINYSIISLPYPNSQLANQKPCLLSWYPRYQVTDLIWPDFWPNLGTVNTHIRLVWSRRGYSSSTASRQNTNHGRSNLRALREYKARSLQITTNAYTIINRFSACSFKSLQNLLFSQNRREILSIKTVKL